MGRWRGNSGGGIWRKKSVVVRKGGVSGGVGRCVWFDRGGEGFGVGW